MGSRSLRLSEEEKTFIRKFRAAKRGVTGPVARIVITTNAPAAPAAPERGEDGRFACQVDPNCTFRAKRLARARVHATADTLQEQGHLPRD